MKIGKKLIFLCLALVLCLSLAACASEEDKAFEAANALLEAGDYDGAIAAFTAIGRYQEINDKINEAIKLREEANVGFLLGTWKDVVSGHTFQFETEGKALLTSAYGQSEITSLEYSYSEGTVRITAPIVLPLQVVEMDGVTHLVDVNNQYDLVPEAEYEALAPIVVEITMDNWQEYFELREVEDVQENTFGEAEYRQPGYAVFLKDEYVERLVTDYNAKPIGFELQYDECMYMITGDFLSGEYELTEGKPWWQSDPLGQGLTATTEVWDRRTGVYSETSDLYNSVSGFFHNAGSWRTSDETAEYICLPINGQIIRAQGTLTLKR